MADGMEPGMKPMMGHDIRPGEKTVDNLPAPDAGIVFIGRIETPWVLPCDCPRQGDGDGPLCRIVINQLWEDALAGIDRHPRLQILYWMDRARRDLVMLMPKSRGEPTGTFALRAPTRPNPIASSIVNLVERQATTLLVRGLDCVDGTPLLDIKPHRDAPGWADRP